MTFEVLDEEIKHLVLLNTNLKKSINKRYKLETLRAKLSYANALYAQMEQNLIETEDELTSSELTFLAKAARNAISDIRYILTRKIDDFKPSLPMANPEPAFDIRQATALVQPQNNLFPTFGNRQPG